MINFIKDALNEEGYIEKSTAIQSKYHHMEKENRELILKQDDVSCWIICQDSDLRVELIQDKDDNFHLGFWDIEDNINGYHYYNRNLEDLLSVIKEIFNSSYLLKSYCNNQDFNKNHEIFIHKRLEAKINRNFLNNENAKDLLDYYNNRQFNKNHNRIRENFFTEEILTKLRLLVI
ncbi:hypothetical protein Bp8pS_172 [Bacillus phage vB_BpuM-BpSp]|nr:hypothetical protein Bp8pS_172 [Bacillus phage vB_BpuM-BpSp]